MAYTDAAKLVSIGTSFMIAGYQLMSSQSALPIIYDQPASVSTPVFAQIFERGSAIIVPSVILVSGASGYLAYMLPEQRRQWITTGALVLAIGPFTSVFMKGGIDRLIEISKGPAAQQVKAEGSGEVLRLLKTWTAQNWVRVGLNVLGGTVGLWTALTDGN